MGYVLAYEQNWSAGNSAFSQVAFYDDTDPDDPLYPEIDGAESVQVNTGGGPSGENTLDNWTGIGSDDDYSTEGVNLHILTAAGSDPVRIVEGKASIWYKPNAQSLSDNAFGYCPLMQVMQFNDTGNIFALAAYPNGAGPTWQLELGSFTPGDIDDSFTFTPVAGAEYLFDIFFKRDDGGSTGYLRLEMNGVVIYNYTGISVKNHSSDLDAIRTAWLGFFGLFGEMTNFRLYELVPSSDRNLLTGSTHTVQGSDNVIAGANGTVTGDRNVLFSLRQD